MTNTQNDPAPIDTYDVSADEARTLHAAAIVLYGIARRHGLPEDVTTAHDALQRLLHGNRY